MKAKVTFYNHKTSIPNELKVRAAFSFGEILHQYGENTDDIYICYESFEHKANQDWVHLGETFYTFIENEKITEVEIYEENFHEINVESFLEGFYKSNYNFDRYRSTKQGQSISLKVPGKFEGSATRAETIANAVHIARDICNEPANKIFPESFSDHLEDLFKETNVEVSIIEGTELKHEGFTAVDIVGRGSDYAPCVAVLTLKTSNEKPLALVGKGVTFDAGGVNVKSGAAIGEMKMDLGGAAAVTGAMKLLADTEASCHVIALLPLVVNVGSAKAYLPSDVIEYRNGTTVEVGNTDAEGRLIIADALLYAQQLGARQIIDIATLTGNVGQALGLKMAAVFSNNLSVSNKVYECGRKSGDHVWPMPLEKEYKRYLESNVADISNMSKSIFAGSITAALFIEHFVEARTKWVHIDMANTSKIFPESDKGASGFGTKLLFELVVSRKELWEC